jgi:hypothetical protein
MSKSTIIEGIAAPLPIANLDTDQIMPKQFLRGIDKAGLDRGVLYDLRFDAEERPRPDFVLNQPAYTAAPIILGGREFRLRFEPGTRGLGTAAVRGACSGCIELWRNLLLERHE